MTRLSSFAPGDWLTAHSRTTPHFPCIVTEERSVSYQEMNDTVTRLAHGLGRRGLRRGDRMTVLATDSLEYIQLALASMKLGSVVVPLNYRLSAAEIATVLTAVGPAVHVCEERYRDSIATVRDVSPALAFTMTFEADRGEADVTFAELAATDDVSEIISISDDEDIIVMMLTSGTTGAPKLVMQSQRMVRRVAHPARTNWVSGAATSCTRVRRCSTSPDSCM